ncbi:MAG TPA: HEAT repeat domain-containing protein [Pyrinomonadaceae bacterium]|nr:HEAT repeat domain-containing protein [Pyrinomonadaceae bacterium]
MLALLTFFWLMLVPPAAVWEQDQRFIPVEGATLQAKQEAAISRAASSRTERFWTAYAFDVRPGVAVDFEFVSEDGNRFYIGESTMFHFDGVAFNNDFGGFSSSGSSIETRDLGVFLLRDPARRGEVVRVEIYNLARRREYGGFPVYWLGRASNEESLTLLRGLVESSRTGDVGEAATRAIALHDDRRVPEVLVALARGTNSVGVRSRAARALGYPPVAAATREFLASVARDERESVDIRRSAISAYGRARDPQALDFLLRLFDSLTHRDLKRSVLSAAAPNENKSAVVNFLIRVANQESDTELRKRAVAHLGEMAGEQALGTLNETAGRVDADTELQKQAVSAISRRPAAESVPLLIKVAQTHPKPEVRKQALVLLGRTGDPSAINYLKSVLTK